MFSLFDDLVLLCGGRVLYCGRASSAVSCFESQGLRCPPHTNPPEFFLDIAQCGTAEERRTVERLAAAHLQQFQSSLSSLPAPAPHLYYAAPPLPSFRPLPFWLQLQYLLQRSQLCVSRSPLLKVAQLLQSVVLGLLVGLSFLRLGLSQTSVQNRLGAVYFSILCIVFANTFAVVLTFTEERAVFLREQAARLYSVQAYFIARTAVDVLPTALCSLLFVCIAYWLMGFAGTAGQFLYFLLVVVLIAYTGQSIGLVVACSCPSRMLAMIVTPLSIAPFIIFTPYALPYADSVPAVLLPCQYLSPFWWSFSGLVANEMSSLLFSCDEQDSISLPGLGVAGLLPTVCPYRKGRDVLLHYGIGYESEDLWRCVWVLLLLAVGYRMIAFALLNFSARRARL